MKYSAGFRSLLDIFGLLALTFFLEAGSFESFVTKFYIVYFFVNLLFSACTTDFLGGKKESFMGEVLIISYIALLIFIFLFLSFDYYWFYLVAIFSCLEAYAFVYSEVNKNHLYLVINNILRTLALILILAFGFTQKLDLLNVINIFFYRDLCLLISCFWFVPFLYKSLKAVKLKNIFTKMQFIYMVVANGSDHATRIIVSIFFGPFLLPSLEYAMRFPRLIQMGFLLILRHRLFDYSSEKEFSFYQVFKLHLLMLMVSISIIFLEIFFSLPAIFFILISSLQATIAVYWYTFALKLRKFYELVIVQFISFIGLLMIIFLYENVFYGVASQTGIIFIASLFWLLRIKPNAH